MRIFIAGIMQGSHLGTAMHNQEYRPRLRKLLAEHLPDAEIYDPLTDHASALDYDANKGRAVCQGRSRRWRSFDKRGKCSRSYRNIQQLARNR